MAHLFVTEAGTLYRREPGDPVRTAQPLPDDVTVITPPVRSDWTLFPALDQMPLVGAWQENLIWFPDRGLLRKMGITAPSAAPGLAAGAGTGITGEVIGKFTFAEMAFDGRLIHESNPSAATATVTLTNQNRTWTLPTTHSNDRVNYKLLYVSVDGADYKLAAIVPLATASYTEAVPTPSLGLEISNRRGVPPQAKFVTKYHGRAWYVQPQSHKAWFSEYDEPESVHTTNWIPTQDRRYITAIRGLTDQLAIGTRGSFQEIQGYTADDFSMRTVTDAINVISHHASQLVNGKYVFLSQDGYYRWYGGGFDYLMPKRRSAFRDAYLANQRGYENSQMVVDRHSHVIKLLVPGEEFSWIGHYLPTEPELGGVGALPDWTRDIRARTDSSVGVLTTDGLKDELYTGSCDGFVRKENVAGNGDDDGDAYRKRMTLVTPHHWLPDQVGDDEHGGQVTSLTAFIKTESNDTVVTVYGGDESAVDSEGKAFTIPAAAVTLPGNKRAVAKTSHHVDNIKVNGKGATVRYDVDAPIGWEYRGQSVEFQGGAQNRPVVAS